MQPFEICHTLAQAFVFFQNRRRSNLPDGLQALNFDQKSLEHFQV
jgi:hypothetical protein